jgi:hypothetical protein
MTNGRLELDQGMSLIVRICRTGLTVGAEIGVVTNGALVSVTSDECVGGSANRTERAITADTNVNSPNLAGILMFSKRFVHGNESVIGMDEACIHNAISAVVPVRAVKTLVANTVDELLLCKYHSPVTTEYGKRTLSQPSQMAWWLWLRPGASIAAT